MATTKKTAAKKTAAKKTVATTTKKVVAAKKVKKVETVFKDTKDTKETKATKATKVEIVPGALIAEILGTFLLASAVIAFAGDKIQVFFALAAIIIIFIIISGAHLNPGITFANWVNKKISPLKAVTFIVAQILGAALAFFVGQAIVNENNATYDDNGTRTVTTLESKLVDAGYAQQEDIDANGIDATIETLTQGQATKEQVAKQLGVSVEYGVAKVAPHKELFAFAMELLGSVILGLGAGYAFLRKNDKCAHSIKSAFAIAGTFILGLAVAGGTAVLNPALAGAFGALPIDFASAWPFVIYILASIIGVTIGFTLYRVVLQDVEEDTSVKL